eukprot:753199-Hanusia_phi.AAC.1
MPCLALRSIALPYLVLILSLFLPACPCTVQHCPLTVAAKKLISVDVLLASTMVMRTASVLVAILLVLCSHLSSSSSSASGEDHYSVLGIPPSSSQQEVKRAYHQLSLKWHPDKWFAEGGAFEGMEQAEVTEEDGQQARAHFYRISTAYEVLADEEQRRLYDGEDGGRREVEKGEGKGQ